MPVLQQIPINEYTASGSGTVFPYTFKVPDEESLKVFIDEVLQPSGYVISDVGNNAGGNVTFTVPPPEDSIVRLERGIPLVRETDYIEGGPLPASVLDGDFDRHTMMLQDLSATTLRARGGAGTDAYGRRISNVGAPVDADDAATKGWVESSETSAVALALGHADDAEASANAAEDSADAAMASQTATAADEVSTTASAAAALASESAAASSETASQISETNAAASAAAALASESAADASETAAAGSASDASDSAIAADASALAASGSATSASNSAIAAAASASAIMLPLPTTSGGSGASYANTAALFNGIKQAASASATGVVEKLTAAEAQAGTDDTRYHSAATMKEAQIQLRASQAAVGLTSVEFTAIPSWAKRITLLVRGVSSSAGNLMVVQLGDSGGYETTGYTCAAVRLTAAGVGTVTESGGVLLSAFVTSLQVHSGTMVLDRVQGNEWVAVSTMTSQSGPIASISNGGKETSGMTDRLRIIATGGDTFVAGLFAISYE